MISEIDKQFVKNKIDDILGGGRNLGKDEIQYYCPFCSHHKPKLQINLESQKWRCRVYIFLPFESHTQHLHF